MNNLEETKIYGEDYDEIMRQHMKLYTGCSILMLAMIGAFIIFVVGVSLFMGAN